jgi:hypothetical protein
MDLSILDSLSEPERAELMAALQPKADPIDQIVKAIEYLCDKVDALDEKVNAVADVVEKEIIGGIKEVYDSNVRADGMSAFRGKYGGILGPLADGFEKLWGGDIHEKAFDFLGSLDGDEEAKDAKLKEIVASIKDKLGIKDEPAAVAVKVEKEAEPSAPEPKKEPDEMESMDDEIARMKKHPRFSRLAG